MSEASLWKGQMRLGPTPTKENRLNSGGVGLHLDDCQNNLKGNLQPYLACQGTDCVYILPKLVTAVF
jgi:hypothetical protein